MLSGLVATSAKSGNPSEAYFTLKLLRGADYYAILGVKRNADQVVN